MILEGTTSTGAVVPVQVTNDGKVVAEGMTGPQGPEGPEGPKGDKGDKGDPGSPGNLWSGSDPGPISYTGGSVGIGNTGPEAELHVGPSGTNTRIRITNDNTGHAATDGFQLSTNAAKDAFVYNWEDANLVFGTNNDEKVRIDSSGRLLVGTPSWSAVSRAVFQGASDNSAGKGILHVARGNTAANLGSGAAIGSMVFSDSAGGAFAEIAAAADATPGADDYPGRLVFSTTANGATSPTPRMTIYSSGAVHIEQDLVLKSPNGTRWAVRVNDSGTLSTTQV